MGAGLTEADLEWMRGVASDRLDRTCTVRTPGATSRDDYDETVAGAPTDLTGVPCSFKPKSAFERGAATGTQAGANFTLYFPALWSEEYLSVPADATVVVDAKGGLPAVTLRVVGAAHSSDGILQTADAIRL